MLYNLFFLITLFSIVSIVFIERKKPGEGLVWILILILLPGLGLLIYFTLGSTLRFKLGKLIHQKRYRQEHEALNKIVQSRIHPIPREDAYSAMALFHNRYAGGLYSAGNDVEMFLSGQEKYKRLFADLQRAEKSIHIIYFSIHNDETGRELARILSQKAKEGVEVRLMYDGIGCLMTPRSFFKGLAKAGVRVQKIRPFLLDINYRNHRKIVVIDGTIAYTGGMNIGDKYRGLHKKKTPFRDTHVRLQGDVVASLQHTFFHDWMIANFHLESSVFANLHEYFPPSQGRGNIKAQVVYSGPDDDENMKMGYLRMIGMARKSLWFQTPYVIPDEVILRALQTAAASGIDVKIMIPSIPGNWFLKHTTNYYLSRLIEYGVRVFLYQGYIHAKTMLMDGRGLIIGSVNVDVRSLAINDEVYVYFDEQDFAQGYEDIFIRDLKSCVELDYEAFSRRGLRAQFAESILSFFSPLI